MASFELGLLLSTLFVYIMAQAPCDPVLRPCTNGVCESLPNQPPGCVCNLGYIPDLNNPLVCNPSTPGPVTCNTIPTTPQEQCINGICQLQASGQNQCVCYQGYQQSINPNVCEDFNECQLSFTGCAAGACMNYPGGYYCTTCISGYTLNQFNKCQRVQNNENLHPWVWWWLLD